MGKRTRVVEAERAAWRVRRPWPTAVLGIDPGSEVAGAGLVLPDSMHEEPVLHWARTIDPYTRALEQAVEDAVAAARARALGLVVIFEAWGTGGAKGITTWIGLGAARGHWERAVHLATAEHPDVLTPSRLFYEVHMGTWRSWMDVPPSVLDERGKVLRRNTPEDWKKAATRRCAELAPRVSLESADAGEAGLIALFGARYDRVGRDLPLRVLHAHEQDRPARVVPTCIYSDCAKGYEQAVSPARATCKTCRKRWKLEPKAPRRKRVVEEIASPVG